MEIIEDWFEILKNLIPRIISPKTFNICETWKAYLVFQFAWNKDCDNLSTEQAHGQTLPSIFAFLVMHCINGGTRETFWLIHIFWDRRYSSRYVKNQLWLIWCMGHMPKLSRTYYIPRKMNVSFKQMLPSLLSLMQKILFNIITCVVQEIRGCG